MEAPFIFIFILVAGVVLFLIVLGARQEMARRQALAALAVRLGFSHDSGKDRTIARQYGFLDTLQSGSNRYAEQVMRGSYQGYDVLLFDYHYETYTHTKKGRETHHHHHNFYLLHLPLQCPELHVYPESFLSRIGQALGASDIDFESDEFSRAFVVKCADKKFAYDVCHTLMMAFLLQHRDLRLEFEGDVIAIGYLGRMQPEKIEHRLDLLAGIRQRLPAYLFQQ